MTQESAVVPGRSCEGCTICCKLFAVEQLAKPPVKWCEHCRIGTGCGAYDDRPIECQQFFCEYLLDPTLDESWKPSRSRIVVVRQELEGEILVHLDPADQDLWRQEPYLSRIRSWISADEASRQKVIVWEGDIKTQLLPGGQEVRTEVPWSVAQ